MDEGYLGLILIVGNSGNENGFHGFILLSDYGARLVGKSGADVNGYVVFFGEFDGSDLEYLGTHAGHFQHFVIRDPVHFSGFATDVRVSGEHARYIGVDFTDVRLDGGSQCHG